MGKAVFLLAGFDPQLVPTTLAQARGRESEDVLMPELADDGLDLAVVDPIFLKPLDKDLLVTEAERTGFVVTVEENVLQGGFGSAVLEMFCEAGVNVPVKRIGLPDKFVEQGSQTELRGRYGLDAKGIIATVKDALAKK